MVTGGSRCAGGGRERPVLPPSSRPHCTEPPCPAWHLGSARIAAASALWQPSSDLSEREVLSTAPRPGRATRIHIRLSVALPLPRDPLASPQASWLPAGMVALSSQLASVCLRGVVGRLRGAVARLTPRRSLCPFMATTLEQGTGSRGKPKVHLLKFCIWDA